jgi:hypothetical protein
VPFDEFADEWEQQEPPEEALKFYGPWPDAIVESKQTTRIGSGANLAETDD